MIRGAIAFGVALAILVMPEWIGGYVASGCQYIDTSVTTPGGTAQVVRECWPAGYTRPRLLTYAEAHGPDSTYPVCYDCGAQPATLSSVDARAQLFDR